MVTYLHSQYRRSHLMVNDYHCLLLHLIRALTKASHFYYAHFQQYGVNAEGRRAAAVVALAASTQAYSFAIFRWDTTSVTILPLFRRFVCIAASHAGFNYQPCHGLISLLCTGTFASRTAAYDEYLDTRSPMIASGPGSNALAGYRRHAPCSWRKSSTAIRDEIHINTR